jgi:hypothetical protein
MMALGREHPNGRSPAQVRLFEFIPIKPLAATDSSAPGNCAAHVQGASAIRSLEMAAKPGMRGRDHKVFDNLETESS